MQLSPNLRLQVVDRLRQRILSGGLPPGTPLREQALAAEFGISRGPIRDAFLALTKEGLLVAKPNAGVKVAPSPSIFKRSVIVQVRRDIETAAITAWFESGDPELPGRLKTNLAQYKKACRSEDMDAVVSLDMEFHLLLVGAVDHGSLVDLWRPVILQMFLRYSRHHTLLDSYSEHLAIYESIRNSDADTAIETLSKHIQ